MNAVELNQIKGKIMLAFEEERTLLLPALATETIEACIADFGRYMTDEDQVMQALKAELTRRSTSDV